MNIQWIGSPNYGSGREGYKPLAIINHIMAGTLKGTDSWFGNPTSGASAHYGVGKDGQIHQYVKDENTAWANGRKSDPDGDWLSHFPNCNPNYWTISIEHEGYPNEVPTEAQIKSTIALQKYLVEKWSIPVDPIHITGHFRIDSISRKDCPGPHFPWDRLYKALKGDYTMKPEDANKLIQTFLVPLWAFAESQEGKNEIGRLADELRLASGQKPQNR